MTDIVDIMPELNELSPGDLLERFRRTRDAIAAAAPEGNFEKVPVTLLHELAAISGILRRRTAGPPKVAKQPAAPKGKRGPALSLDDALGDLS